jgi:hypothetical protein
MNNQNGTNDICVTLSSTSLINSAGMVRYLQNLYRDAPAQALVIAAATWSALRADALVALVSGQAIEPWVTVDVSAGTVSLNMTSEYAGECVLLASQNL